MAKKSTTKLTKWTNNKTTTGATTYTKPATTTKTTTTAPEYKLKPTVGWELNDQPAFSASQLAVKIMRFRRQYRSEGIANFAKTWLVPTLKAIVTALEQQGYTVAYCHTSDTTHGYANYCFDVSKDGVMGDTLYVAHYDTVDKDYQSPVGKKQWDHITKTWVEEQVTYQNTAQLLYKDITVKDGIASLTPNVPANTGVGCLGADDGAGLAVMLNLMKNGVLGGYCFTTGEEVGGIGAEEVLKEHPTFLKQYKRSIEIDRRRCEEIIYEQSMGECASEEFTKWLCDELGMGHKPSEFGSYTDVATFAELIPENVNIASGYINAHTVNEQVDLVYLDKLAEQLAKVDWTKAPSKRTAGDYGTKGYGDGYYGYGYEYGYGYGNYGTANSGKFAGALTDNDLKSLHILFTLDRDFMRYALSETIETPTDFDRVLMDWYGMGLVELPDLITSLVS